MMIDKAKRHWRDIVIVVLVLLLSWAAISDGTAKATDTSQLQEMIDWQGNKIQELQKKVEEGRIIPQEFVSIEQLKLWIVEQSSWLTLNPGWTWEEVNRLQHTAARDGYSVNWMLVKNIGTMKEEYWPLVKIGEVVYWIEPMTHDVKQYYPFAESGSGKETSGWKLPDWITK